MPWGQVSSLIPAGQGVAASAADLDSLGVGTETVFCPAELMILSPVTTSQHESIFYVIVSKGTRAGEYGEGSSIILNDVQIYFSKYIRRRE